MYLVKPTKCSCSHILMFEFKKRNSNDMYTVRKFVSLSLSLSLSLSHVTDPLERELKFF